MSTIELATHTWGDSGPPVVLMHGLSSAGYHYDNLAPTLVADGWRVIAPDFRGHGDSPRAPGTYTITHYAADVEALLESLGEPAVLGGHSLGGATAVYLAGSRPDLVRGAFAEDPPLYHGQPGVMAASGYSPVFTIMRDEMRAAQAADDPEATIRDLLTNAVGWWSAVGRDGRAGNVRGAWCVRSQPAIRTCGIRRSSARRWPVGTRRDR